VVDEEVFRAVLHRKAPVDRDGAVKPASRASEVEDLAPDSGAVDLLRDPVHTGRAWAASGAAPYAIASIARAVDTVTAGIGRAMDTSVRGAEDAPVAEGPVLTIDTISRAAEVAEVAEGSCSEDTVAAGALAPHAVCI